MNCATATSASTAFGSTRETGRGTGAAAADIRVGPYLDPPRRFAGCCRSHANGHSKSFHWIVTPSVSASQFGTLSVRVGPAPREISWNDVVPVGGELAGMYTSAPWMNGNPLSTGSGELRSVWPSRFRSNAKNALTCLLIGHRV